MPRRYLDLKRTTYAVYGVTCIGPVALRSRVTPWHWVGYWANTWHWVGWAGPWHCVGWAGPRLTNNRSPYLLYTALKILTHYPLHPLHAQERGDLNSDGILTLQKSYYSMRDQYVVIYKSPLIT